MAQDDSPALRLMHKGKLMKKYLLGLLLAVFAFAGTAHAASIDFTMGGGSSVNISNPDSIEASAVVRNLAGYSFNLTPTDSHTFDFFDIVFSCDWLVCGGMSNISATLDFYIPDASATGSGWGGAVSLLGTITAGVLHWTSQPGEISTAAGDFLVTFSNLVGITGNTATVQATVTALSAVPLPAAGWLFGSALLGLMGWRRRSQR